MLLGVSSRDHLFIVRTWLESPGDTQTMRGRIEHVGSGRRRYFANFGDLCDFIASTQAFAPSSACVEADDQAGPC
jgi:hypothetical protein